MTLIRSDLEILNISLRIKDVHISLSRIDLLQNFSGDFMKYTKRIIRGIQKPEIVSIFMRHAVGIIKYLEASAPLISR